LARCRCRIARRCVPSTRRRGKLAGAPNSFAAAGMELPPTGPLPPRRSFSLPGRWASVVDSASTRKYRAHGGGRAPTKSSMLLATHTVQLTTATGHRKADNDRPSRAYRVQEHAPGGRRLTQGGNAARGIGDGTYTRRGPVRRPGRQSIAEKKRAAAIAGRRTDPTPRSREERGRMSRRHPPRRARSSGKTARRRRLWCFLPGAPHIVLLRRSESRTINHQTDEL